MSAVVFCCIVLFVNILLWIVFFIQHRKKFSAEKILSDIKTEVNKLLTEINREADRSITLIDARRKGLQKLVDDAKRYTELANSELSKRARSQNILNTLQPDTQSSKSNSSRKKLYPSGSTVVQQSLFADNPESLFTALAENQSDEVVISENVSAFSSEQPFDEPLPQITMATQPIRAEKDIRTQVLELAAEGFSSDLIATKLEVSITEVQLIIDMYGI